MKNAKRRQRLRGTCKWGGVTLAVSLMTLLLISGRYAFMLRRHAASGNCIEVGCDHGHFFVRCAEVEDPPLSYSPMWTFRTMESADFVLLWGEFERWQYDNRNWSLGAPLWIPVVLIALPTGYLFWSDHRKRMRPNACASCGYDLTGNTTGRCSECGVESDVVK